jgi:hypothetical protein
MLVPDVAIFFQRLVDDRCQRRGSPGVQLHRRDRRFVQYRIKQPGRGRAGEWPGTRRHLIQHHPEGK